MFSVAANSSYASTILSEAAFTSEAEGFTSNTTYSISREAGCLKNFLWLA